MTTTARIYQDDVTRAVKALKAAGVDRARIVLDLNNARIDIIIGEPVPDSADQRVADEWTDDDV